MRHPASRMLFAYWDGLRGERAAPDRGEIEPGEIRHILADTFILETDKGDRPAFRLAGTRLCALFGNELKGTALAQLWPEAERHEVGRLTAAVLDDAAGIVGGVRGTTASGQTIDLEMMLLPLRHRGKTHSRLLGAMSPATIPLWLGLEPVVSLSTLSLRVIWPSGRAEPPENRAERRSRLVVYNGGRA